MDIAAVGDWNKAPCAVSATSGDVGTSVLKSVCVFADKAVEDGVGDVGLGESGKASGGRGKCIVGLGRNEVCVAELLW